MKEIPVSDDTYKLLKALQGKLNSNIINGSISLDYIIFGLTFREFNSLLRVK